MITILILFFILVVFIMGFEFFSLRKNKVNNQNEKKSQEYPDYSGSYTDKIHDMDPRIKGVTEKIQEFSLKLLAQSDDLPTKLKIETIRNRYLHKIITAYQDVPMAQRDVIFHGASAYTMTADQLGTLYAALQEIEAQMLEQKHQTIKVNQRVVKQVLKQEQYL